MRLRYAGALPVTFVALGLEVEPGTEFEVDDVAGQRLLARADVEEVPLAPVRRGKAGKSATTDEIAGAAPAPVTEEVDRGVSDDH
jgi:hypothetical protein